MIISATLLMMPLFGFLIVPEMPLNLKFKQMGYGEPGLFLYRVTECDAKGKLIHADTLGLYCSAALNEQSRMQWQVMRTQYGQLVPDEKSYDGSYTINDITDSLLFIHPPRSDRYRILQFCPYPNFVNGTPHGVWTWEFAIGPIWATPPTYPIKNVDTFHVRYAYNPAKSGCAAGGNIMRYSIAAVSESKYGKATSEFTINANGLIHWKAIPANGHIFQFYLIKHLRGTAAIASNRQFARLNAEREQRNRTTSTKRAMEYLGVGGK
ncbi:MAG: hypothetical protein KF744_13165 [Taibaiella sp.]|nr:hypothetical protein [Taibaiella sp.]